MSLLSVLMVALGGALGALARYAVTGPVLGGLGHRFPWGVLAVNLVGCFLMGLAMYAYLCRGGTDDRLRLFFVAGFLGSLTTFSALGFDTFELVRGGFPWLAIANVLANVVLGTGLVAAGWQVGRLAMRELPEGV